MTVSLRETEPPNPPFPISEDLVIIGHNFAIQIASEDVFKIPLPGDGIGQHMTFQGVDVDGNTADVTVIVSMKAALALAVGLSDGLRKYIRWMETGERE